MQFESDLEFVLDAVKDHAVIRLDPEGKVVGWNAGAESILGYRKEEILGHGADIIFTDEDRARCAPQEELRVVRETGKAEDNRWHVLKNGHLLFATGSMYPIKEPSGRLIGYIKVLRDATALRQHREELQASEIRLQEAHAEVELVANSLPLIVWTADANGYVDWYNDWWYEYLGLPKGVRWDDAEAQPMHPDDVERTNVLWYQAVHEGKTFEMEQRFRRGSDGQYRWHVARGVPVRDKDGKIIKYIGGNTDIHDEKMLSEELRRARREAEAASHSKSSFLANMSHEIRTPMTAILGFTELLRDPELSPEEKLDSIARIENSGRALLRLIDDILDISKIEAGALTIQKSHFSPLGLLSEVVSMMRVAAERKGIRLRVKTGPQLPGTAHCDPSRVRQILVNLIGNAIKFTDRGEVVVTVDSRDGEYLRFEVCDEGIGISEKDRDRLFQPFVQADESISRRFGGTGLGLMLSKRLAEQMGGSLWLDESEVGKGSRFVVETYAAPFNAIAEMEDVTSTQEVPQKMDRPLTGLKLLIAEDTADNRVLLNRYLKDTGADTEFAVDGAEAIKKARASRYDLILMDIQMPNVDGIQAAKALRLEGYTGPLVALTAHAMPEERERSMRAGYNAHLTKPVGKQALIAAIREYSAPLS